MADKLTILCVDDDEDALFIIALSLELDREIHTFKAHGGREALRFLEQIDSHVDGIVLDVRMQGLDGPTVLTAIHRISGHERTPVIFLTSDILRIASVGYATLGAVGAIAKPFDPLALAAEVRKLLAA